MLFFVGLLFIIISLFNYINTKQAPSFKKKVAIAASALKDLGISEDDLLDILKEKIGESKLQSMIKESEAKKQGKKQAPLNIVVQELVPTLIRDRINLPGIIEPWVRLNVLSEVKGQVMEKLKNEGDVVEKGDEIARIDSQDYRIAYNSTRASYQASLASLNRLKKLKKLDVSTQSQLDNAKAQMENDKSAMDSAALNLKRCTIRSPITGVINRVFIDVGQYMDYSEPLVEILQMNNVKVKVGIPESDVESIRKLTDFKVTIDALEKKVFQAKKHFLSKTADDSARLYSLELTLSNLEGEILPDMFARVEIVKTEIKDSISIPLYAVITRNNDRMVYTVEDGKIQSKSVTLGLQEGWLVEIREGLSHGHRVVVVGQRSVSDGQKVNVVRTVRDPRKILP